MRPIEDQVVVITGASSGIGRAAALEFAAQGASVVAAARTGEALDTLVGEIQATGGRAEAVTADVSNWDEVESLASAALARFGRVDTWINNAGVALYGMVDDTPPEELAQVVRVDLLGVMLGSKAAIPALRASGGGTLINVASVAAERGVPLLAAYSAAKHGVRGFSEALRLELEREKTGIHVTVVEPSSIDTPFFEHARSRLGELPQPIPPAYPPEAVVEALVRAAEYPQRTIVVGGAGRLMIAMQRLAPGAMDRAMMLAGLIFRAQRSGRPDDREDNLYEPSEQHGRVRGRWAHMTVPSVFTPLFELHPLRTRLLSIGALAVVVAAVVGRRRAEN